MGKELLAERYVQYVPKGDKSFVDDDKHFLRLQWDARVAEQVLNMRKICGVPVTSHKRLLKKLVDTHVFRKRTR